MINKKKKILLIWGYNRKNWVEHFEALNQEFEFIYLFYRRKEEETEVYTNNKRIYFTNFINPKSLLNEIKPEKVIFMGFDSLYCIAINIECKRRNLPTFYMAHGAATLAIEDYVYVKYEKRNLLDDFFSTKVKDWARMLWFLISSLAFKNLISLPKLLKYQFEKTKIHPILAMSQNKTPLRNPSGYILFAEEAKDFFTKQDHADPSTMYVLGNLEITSFTKLKPVEDPEIGKYILYLETPLSDIEGTPFDINILKREEYNELIGSMNKYAKNLGMKLVIKLHPYSFENTFLVKDDNIIYRKAENKELLILNSTGIIFYNSSLAIPALYYKTGLMFTIGKLDDFQQKIQQTNSCYVCDYRVLLKKADKLMFLKEESKFDKTVFNKMYIGNGADGKGLERLSDILNT